MVSRCEQWWNSREAYAHGVDGVLELSAGKKKTDDNNKKYAGEQRERMNYASLDDCIVTGKGEAWRATNWSDRRDKKGGVHRGKRNGEKLTEEEASAFKKEEGSQSECKKKTARETPNLSSRNRRSDGRERAQRV